MGSQGTDPIRLGQVIRNLGKFSFILELSSPKVSTAYVYMAHLNNRWHVAKLTLMVQLLRRSNTPASGSWEKIM